MNKLRFKVRESMDGITNFPLLDLIPKGLIFFFFSEKDNAMLFFKNTSDEAIEVPENEFRFGDGNFCFRCVQVDEQTGRETKDFVWIDEDLQVLPIFNKGDASTRWLFWWIRMEKEKIEVFEKYFNASIDEISSEQIKFAFRYLQTPDEHGRVWRDLPGKSLDWMDNSIREDQKNGLL